MLTFLEAWGLDSVLHTVFYLNSVIRNQCAKTPDGLDVLTYQVQGHSRPCLRNE